MTKLTKHFLTSLSAEWEQGYHRLNKEKKIQLAEKFWREAHEDSEDGKALLRDIGKIILTKLLPNQLRGEGFDTKNITVVVTEAHGNRTVPTSKPENRLERHGEI